MTDSPDLQAKLRNVPIQARSRERLRRVLQHLLDRRVQEPAGRVVAAHPVAVRPEQLRDLSADPAHAAIRGELRKQLIGWLAEQGDSLTLWIDPGTHRQQRVEVRTFLETRAVAIVSEFRSLPGGPSYAARTIVDYPSESLQVITDSYDYEL